MLRRDFSSVQNNLDESENSGQRVSNLVGGEREQAGELGVRKGGVHGGIL